MFCTHCFDVVAAEAAHSPQLPGPAHLGGSSRAPGQAGVGLTNDTNHSPKDAQKMRSPRPIAMNRLSAWS